MTAEGGRRPCGHTSVEHVHMMTGRMAGACDYYPSPAAQPSESEREPPAAHPPEGSREPQKWPCRVAKGTQCSSEMCEPPTPPPGPLLDTRELCGGTGKVWPASPPGPGQDREARLEAALHGFIRVQHTTYDRFDVCSSPVCIAARAALEKP
jgi:hypothetical protein